MFLGLAALLVTVGALFAMNQDTASAGTVVTNKGDGDIPFFGRTVLGDDEWSLVYFYYETDCVTDNAIFGAGDLIGLIWFNPTTFGCDPATTEGNFLFMAGGPPIRINLTGKGDVPIWFVKTDELKNDFGNTLTFADLKSMTHLEGSASKFKEILHTDVRGQSLLKVNAEGTLEDGTGFKVSTSYHLYRDTPGTGPESAVITFK